MDAFMEDAESVRKRASETGNTDDKNTPKGASANKLLLLAPPIIPPSPSSRQEQKRAKVALTDKGLPKKNHIDKTNDAPIAETPSGLRGAQ